ncbi:glycoside hydrolase family 26 protein [Cerasicoccus arenae]|uniref:GH26 domain-containing protein n=1 Tax=Cerasicoccus arenae TaxID=424488 RepID=A0A8J3DK56_9BACT|nr:glycosyl hydrolase [Cerasicoccus arenae]MBK1859864.1 hypothetical protein [Cerasicoccus arenae]GHC13434.1 hypothetical protein GCM10007047_33510 [Cerasicoccus arenae]
MTKLKCFKAIALFFATLQLLSTHAADEPKVNDNSEPYIVTYRWGVSGAVKGLYDAYGDWIGCQSVWAEDFMPNEGWNKIEGEEWQLATWRDWNKKYPGRRLILSVPILPGGWDRNGPSIGPGVDTPVSLEEGGAGAYNEYFVKLAENLVAYGLGDTIVRPGWEFNGGWYAWRADNKELAPHFAAYFREIVKSMRSVPGAGGLKFLWNPAMEPWWPYDPALAWPGDDFVDYVGVDVYDQSWAKDTYPFPEGASPDEIERRQRKVWDEVKNNVHAYGLPYWVKFAKERNKPLTIPEWGVCARKDGHGGDDNPFFIRKMHEFISNPDNNVAFQCYFDVDAHDGAHQLCPDPTGKTETKFPKSSAAFLELFSKASE